VRDAVLTQDLKKPTVAVLCDEFVVHGRTMAGVLGHPNLELLILPYPMEGRAPDELHRIAEEFYPKLLAMLGART
jgi:hypothetical protein